MSSFTLGNHTSHYTRALILPIEVSQSSYLTIERAGTQDDAESYVENLTTLGLITKEKLKPVLT